MNSGEVQIIQHTSAPREFIARGIPTFGTVNVFWATRCFAQLRHPMNRTIRDYIVVGNEVGLARNHIIELALGAEERDPSVRCSHVFFLDDDVLVHPDGLLKLLADDRPIVSGLYFAKSSVPQPLVLHEEGKGVATKWQPGDIVDCWAHGMGLTLIRTEVFRRMRDQIDLGVDECGRPAWFKTTRDKPLYRNDGTMVFVNETEDVWFLRHAASLGYQPCVDTSAAAFGFHWAEAEKQAYPLDQWHEFNDKGTITWPDTRDGNPVVWGQAA